jgi:hypothetical protein
MGSKAETAQALRRAKVAEALRSSPLAAAQGLLKFPILESEALHLLWRDAAESFKHATVSRVTALAHDAGRGMPDHWLASAPCGRALNDFYASDDLLTILTDATRTHWEPAGPTASWSYFCEPGHYLGLHRDVTRCNLAVVICVAHQGGVGGGVGGAGQLRAWPDRTDAPLSAIRDDPGGAVELHVRPGEGVILLGGLIAHEVTPVRETQLRVVAPLCYRPSPG